MAHLFHALIESADMIRHASDPAPWVKKPALQTSQGGGSAPPLVTSAPPRTLSLDRVAAAVTLAPANVARSTQRVADIPIRDWEVLFCAVKDRLGLAVGVGQAPDGTHERRSGSGVVRGPIVECVQALNRLHGALLHELDRCEQLEMTLFDTQTALAQARAELVGTQAGELRARYLAAHDSLTSLPNRGFFGERLERALAHAAPQRQALAVLYLDLDGFKPINDLHGHAVGDELLRVVSARLSRVVRADDMVSRVGGDEFACLLVNLSDREQLIQLAGKMFDVVTAPCLIGAHKLSVRPSIGIAVCPTDGTTAEALIRCADAAMYRAKRDQTGHAFFDQSLAT